MTKGDEFSHDITLLSIPTIMTQSFTNLDLGSCQPNSTCVGYRPTFCPAEPTQSIPYPGDCSSAYICADAGVIAVLCCLNGTTYDPAINYCAVNSFTCPEKDIAAGCDGPKDCLYPYPNCPYGFIECTVNADGRTGTPVLEACAFDSPPLIFNNTEKECDYPPNFKKLLHLKKMRPNNKLI